MICIGVSHDVLQCSGQQIDLIPNLRWILLEPRPSTQAHDRDRRLHAECVSTGERQRAQRRQRKPVSHAPATRKRRGVRYESALVVHAGRVSWLTKEEPRVYMRKTSALAALRWPRLSFGDVTAIHAVDSV
jgi:hypothetical protein